MSGDLRAKKGVRKELSKSTSAGRNKKNRAKEKARRASQEHFRQSVGNVNRQPTRIAEPKTAEELE